MSDSKAQTMTRNEKLKVTVDESRCIGIGSCEVLAARHFRLNENRIAEFFDAADVDDEAIMEAAMECPVEAIRIESEEGEVLWPPY